MKKFLKIFAVVLLVVLLYLRISIYPQLDLISGFSAKSVASGHFIDGRSLETIQQGDNDIDKIDWATNEINDAGKWVTSTVNGLKQRKAIYRPGLGATLINDDFDTSKPYEVPKRAKHKTQPFPLGNVKIDSVFSNIDYAKLNAVVENAFDNMGAVIKTTKSKTGKYTSVSINVNMNSPEDVVAKYIEVSTIEGIISF